MRTLALAALAVCRFHRRRPRRRSAPGPLLAAPVPGSTSSARSPAPRSQARSRSNSVTRVWSIAPAGDKTPNTGHFHLLIDQALPTDLSVPLPATDHLLHYGKAQTEVTLDASKLPPGKHTLQLVMGDGSHVPHSPALVSKKITITVE